MKEMRKRNKAILLGLLLALAVVAFPVGIALAATTDTVTITATPEYLSITLTEYDNGANDGNWTIGTVSTNSGYWWDDEGGAQADPSFPLGDANSSGNVTSGASVAQDIDIRINNGEFTSSGINWTVISGDPTGLDDQVRLRAGNSTVPSEAGMLALSGTDQEIMNALGAGSWKTIELHLETGTFTHGNQQTGTVTVTATTDT